MKTHFSREIPNLQVVLDSTSLGLFKECPRKYYYSMVEDWATKGSNVHLEFGIHFHSAIEHFEKERSQGLEFEQALYSTVKFLLALGERTEEGWVPWDTDDKYKNRRNLFMAVVWYLEKFKDDPAKTIILYNGKPAIELSFKMELDHQAESGETFMLAGHLDRVVEFLDSVWVMDHKTTKSTISSNFFRKFNPDNQMSIYTAASMVVLQTPASGVMINAIQITTEFARYARGFTKRSPAQIDEFFKDIHHWLDLLEHYAISNYWPMNDKSCQNYGGCPFRSVCAASPKNRELELRSNFVQWSWNPLENR